MIGIEDCIGSRCLFKAIEPLSLQLEFINQWWMVNRLFIHVHSIHSIHHQIKNDSSWQWSKKLRTPGLQIEAHAYYQKGSDDWTVPKEKVAKVQGVFTRCWNMPAWLILKKGTAENRFKKSTTHRFSGPLVAPPCMPSHNHRQLRSRSCKRRWAGERQLFVEAVPACCITWMIIPFGNNRKSKWLDDHGSCKLLASCIDASS